MTGEAFEFEGIRALRRVPQGRKKMRLTLRPHLQGGQDEPRALQLLRSKDLDFHSWGWLRKTRRHRLPWSARQKKT